MYTSCMVEGVPTEPSGFTLAFTNLVTAIKTFRAHIGEVEEDLTEFDTAVENFDGQLAAIAVDLEQIADDTRIADFRFVFVELMAAEKMIEKQIEDIRVDERISVATRSLMAQKLVELLHEQEVLLEAFPPSAKN